MRKMSQYCLDGSYTPCQAGLLHEKPVNSSSSTPSSQSRPTPSLHEKQELSVISVSSEYQRLTCSFASTPDMRSFPITPFVHLSSVPKSVGMDQYCWPATYDSD